MFVITNLSKTRLSIDGVDINPDQQLTVSHLTEGMIAARNGGQLRCLPADETLAERKADTEAFKPFKTGDPAIDG